MTQDEIRKLRQIIRLQQLRIDMQDLDIEELKALVQALVDKTHGQTLRITELEEIVDRLTDDD